VYFNPTEVDAREDATGQPLHVLIADGEPVDQRHRHHVEVAQQRRRSAGAGRYATARIPRGCS
jgi:uncharacterized protein YegL